MFTTPCFIRKNTPELRKKLEDMGYIDATPNLSPLPEYADIVTLNDKYHQVTIGKYNAIDCDENVGLFLALAALRDDSDIHQYHICQADVFEDVAIGDFVLKGGADDARLFFEPLFRKATPAELIEHFKNNE